MKICHVNLASGFSGGERQTLSLIREQQKNGYQLFVVANPKSPFVDEIRSLGIDVITPKHFLVGHYEAKAYDFDLVHVHEGKALYWAAIHRVLCGKPYVVTRRIDNPLKQKALLRWAYKKASAVVGLSSAIEREISLALPQIKVDRIPSSPVAYPVDEARVSDIRKKFSDKYLVIQAATLLHHKGYDVSIECARQLEATHPDIHFCFLGAGPEEAALKAQATGLSNVSFMGKQSSMGDWFSAADVLIHPSYSEGLGSVILEALNAGLPVIGTRAGGIPDIIKPDENGLLITPGDSQALATSILRIKDDSALNAIFEENRDQSLMPFRIEHTAKVYQALYERVLSL